MNVMYNDFIINYNINRQVYTSVIIALQNLIERLPKNEDFSKRMYAEVSDFFNQIFNSPMLCNIADEIFGLCAYNINEAWSKMLWTQSLFDYGVTLFYSVNNEIQLTNSVGLNSFLNLSIVFSKKRSVEFTRSFIHQIVYKLSAFPEKECINVITALYKIQLYLPEDDRESLNLILIDAYNNPSGLDERLGSDFYHVIYNRIINLLK